MGIFFSNSIKLTLCLFPESSKGRRKNVKENVFFLYIFGFKGKLKYIYFLLVK